MMDTTPLPTRSTEDLLTAYAESRDDRLRTQIIERHENLVRSLAHKFARPGVPADDLVQCAWIGLIGAVDRFDPAHGTRFSTYAVHCAVGEIKRYFRDKTWALKVPRQLQELSSALPTTEERLYRTLQRPPTVAEMAEALQVSEEDVLRAMDLGHAYCPAGLDETFARNDKSDSLSVSETVGVTDERMETIVERSDLDAALGSLDERNRRIIHLRFMRGASQQEVAEELGLSQMHISRLERKALAQLRTAMSAH
jgi:RNA polymerase sigma-B factor